MRHGEDRVAGEFLADDALHDFVCFAVDAVLLTSMRILHIT